MNAEDFWLSIWAGKSTAAVRIWVMSIASASIPPGTIPPRVITTIAVNSRRNCGTSLLCERGGIPDFVKVLDFGLVKDSSGSDEHADPQLSSANAIAGTPLYMAPESITKPKEVDARVDLYALGCVGYWLLTARPPFEGANLVEICSHHLHTPPTRPSRILGAPVDERLEALLLKCLAKSPAERPASAKVLADALKELAVALPWTEEEARAWWARRARKSPSEKAARSTRDSAFDDTEKAFAQP